MMYQRILISSIVGVLVLSSQLIPITGTPTCNPTTYSISLGINTTTGTTLTTIQCTPASGSVAFSLDTSSDGYTYFQVDSTTGIITLANRLDVEYGQIKWDVYVVADDGVATAATATVSATTFQSTTTTSSTQPPPGYDWFENMNNKILFWCVMGFTAIICGSCILMCFRFHRVGRCLPDSCPEYEQLQASFKRQVTCCPLPCNFYAKNKSETLDIEEVKVEDVRDDVRRNSQPSTLKPKPATPKELGKTKKSFVADVPDPVTVMPLVIGNTNLNDVGFDGMRSPGFNAPMFTTYGGKKGTASRVHKKY